MAKQSTNFTSSCTFVYTVIVILLAITCIPRSTASLIFNSNTVVIDPGDPLSLDCGVDGSYRYCFWEKSESAGGGPARTYQVQDVHDGRLQGYSKPSNTKGNECGIVINQASMEDHGDWTCRVFVPGNSLAGTKVVVVTVKPQPPLLNINESPLVVNEHDQKDVVCTVSAARPAAGIRWFIGSEDVTARSESQNIPTDDVGTYRSVSTMSYTFHHTENRKLLRCSITHATLEEPEYSEVPLDVRYPPYPISSTRIYGVPMAEEYEIKYNFTANPVPPDVIWYVNNIELPVPGESSKYVSSIRTLMDNIYMATLRIRDFTEEDLDTTYKLFTKNRIGERTFDINLSTGPAPPDGDSDVSGDGMSSSADQAGFEDSIGGGTLAAIVVIVLFILVLLFIIGVMRYRQMYCFGPTDKIKDHLKESGENLKEEHSDTESAAARESNGTKTKATTNFFKNVSYLIRPKKTQKEPRLDKIEEGEMKEEKEPKETTDDSVRRTQPQE